MSSLSTAIKRFRSVSLLLLLLFIKRVRGATDPSDVDALNSLKTAFTSSLEKNGYSLPFLPSWDGSDPCGDDWEGIYECVDDSFGDYQRVSKLVLIGRNLTGEIPPSVWKLSYLTSLSLGNNPGLRGELSPEIESLKKLENLDLHGCALSGRLPPELFSLTLLRSLFLSNNGFTGVIPTSISSLTSLVNLDLSRNALQGDIPQGMKDITGLTLLNLAKNQIEGSVPGELGSIGGLKHLYLQRNLLSGELPPDLVPVNESSPNFLEAIRISYNSFAGSIPPSYLSSPFLRVFEASSCGLQGQIPSLMKCASLQDLDLSQNNLSGPFPSAIGSIAPSLFSILLNNNQLHGEIPGEKLLNLMDLQVIDVSNNSLEGDIPDLSTLPSLEIALFTNNKFNALPAELEGQQQNYSKMLQGHAQCAALPFSLLSPSLRQQCASLPEKVYEIPASDFPCTKITCASGYYPNPYIFATNSSCLCSTPVHVRMEFPYTSFVYFTQKMETLFSLFAWKLSTQNVEVVSQHQIQFLYAREINDDLQLTSTEIYFRIYPMSLQWTSPAAVRSVLSAINDRLIEFPLPFGSYVLNEISFRFLSFKELMQNGTVVPTPPKKKGNEVEVGLVFFLMVGAAIAVSTACFCLRRKGSSTPFERLELV